MASKCEGLLRRIARRWAAPLAMLSVLCVASCQKESSPSAPRRQAAGLAISAQINGAGATQLRVGVFYLRAVQNSDPVPVTIFDQTFPLATGASSFPVSVDLAGCDADQARLVPGPGCVVNVQLSLMSGSSVLDVQTVSAVSLIPDQTTTLPSVVLSPVASLAVTPAAASIVVGDSLQLTAVASDVNGQPLTGRTVTWTSSDATVASVSASGMVKGIAANAQPVTITAATGSRSATAQITVRPAVSIQLSPNIVTFAASSGGALPPAQTVTVSNPNGGAIPGLALGTVAYRGATGWLQATLSGNVITLAILRSNLSTGSDTAIVPVTSPAASNSPQNLTVVYRIGQGPLISVTPSAVTFSAVAGSTNPAAKTVAIANSGGGVLSGLSTTTTYAAGKPTGWLAATLSQTTAPAALTLQPNIGSLPSAFDTLSATMTVKSSVAGVSPQTVTVTLFLAPAPSITLSTSIVTFGASKGAAAPAPATVTISNGGGGTLSGLALGTTTYQPAATAWLQATLSGSTVTLTILTTNLTAGSYNAFVPVTSPAASNSPQTILVTLTIGQGPIILATPPSLSFTAVAKGANPAAQQSSITNVGGGTLSGLVAAVTYAGGQPTGWLSATLSQTTAPATLTLQPNIAALPSAYDTLKATVTLTSSVPGVTPQPVVVTLFLSPQPSIVLNPASVALAATQGGAAPAPATVTISNGGGGTLSGVTLGTTTYQPTGTAWLQTALSGNTITATVVNTSLAPGTYKALVPVSSPVASNSPQTLTVTLTVGQGPVITPAPTTLAFNGVQGGTNPTSQAVNITNTGGGTLTGLTATVAYAGGQPTGWLGTTLSSGTAPAQLTVQPALAGLTAGTYNATITLKSTVAGVAPVTVAVTLNVVTAPKIVLTPSNTHFNMIEGGSILTMQTIQITNGGGDTLSPVVIQSVTFRGTSGATAWMAASGGGNSLTYKPTTSLLAPGNDTAFVTLTSAGASNSPYVDTVTATVAPGPIIGVTPKTMSFTAAAGGASPAAQEDTVSNAGVSSTTLDGLAVTVAYGASQPTGWLAATLNRTTAPAFITVTPATTALAAGTYNGFIIVSTTTLPGVAPDTIAVTLTVSQGASLVLSSDTLTFDVQAGGPDPSAQTVTVSNGGGGSLGTIGLDSPVYASSLGAYQQFVSTWANSSSVVGSTITVAPVISSLPVATYVATLPVTATGATNSPQSLVVIVHVTTNWNAIATGLNHTCAIDGNSDLYCWGDNSFGQLGINFGPFSGGESNPLKVTGGGTKWKSVYAAGNHTCAIDIQNVLWCWGQNDKGEVGNGSFANVSAPYAPQYSDLATNTTAVALGTDFTCAVEGPNKAINCWGNNDHFQVDYSSTLTFNTPFPVSDAPTTFDQLQAGAAHVCGINTASVTMYCWGADSLGQLGDSTLVSARPLYLATAVPLSSGGYVAAVSSGGNHTCVIGFNQIPWCWGADRFGQVGNGITPDSALLPTIARTAPSGFFNGVTVLSTGPTHSCVVLGASAGQTLCWGSNQHGELGLGFFSPDTVWAAQTAAGGSTGFTTISAGGNFTCGIGNDDLAYCWGDAALGKLGNAAGASGPSVNTRTPILGQAGNPLPAPRVVRKLPGISPARTVPTRITPSRAPSATPIRRPPAPTGTAH